MYSSERRRLRSYIPVLHPPPLCYPRYECLHVTLPYVERDRRRSKRVPLQETVSISLGNGSDIATGVSDNVSLGGALLYCDRFISQGSEVSFVIVLPLELTGGVAVQVWCSGKVRRIEKQLKQGKFGIAVEFLSVQRLPRA